MRHRKRVETLGWIGELLVQAVLKRNELIYAVHNSMADADDPTIGISLHGQEIRIPLPDFTVSYAGGTLFTRQLPAKTYYVEVKTKSYFGYFKNWDCATTGFDNWALELYHRLSEEHGWEVKVWFVQSFNRCQAAGSSYIHRDAVAGIYEADICELYYSRPTQRFNEMAFWPVSNSVLKLINTRDELAKSEDTAGIVSELIQTALRETELPPDPSQRM